MNIRSKGHKKGFFESVQVQEKKTKVEKFLKKLAPLEMILLAM